MPFTKPCGERLAWRLLFVVLLFLGGCARMAENMIVSMLLPNPRHEPEYVPLQCAGAAPVAPPGLRIVATDSFGSDEPAVAIAASDARPQGDTLIWESFTEEEKVGDDTFETSGSYPVILREPLDRTLSADLRNLLEGKGIAVQPTAPRRLDLRVTGSSVRVVAKLARRSLIVGGVDVEAELWNESEGVVWNRQWSAVDTLHSFSPSTRHYAEAIQNAYCRLLDQAVLSLDSVPLGTAPGAKQD